MSFAVDFEIGIARQKIREEAEADLKRDQFAGNGRNRFSTAVRNSAAVVW